MIGKVLGSLTVIILALAWFSEALTTTVLPPISTSGTPVGLIILPGAFLTADQYKQTGEAVQNASKQKVFIALSGGFIADTVNPIEIEDSLRDAIEKLRAAGLPSDAPIFAAGHSLAGVFLPPNAVQFSSIKGILIWGSAMEDMTKTKLPLMSISGDLDGQTRLTRIVPMYREVDETGSLEQRLRYPVVLLEGVNHAHFASGKMPPLVEAEDLDSPLSSEDGKRLIASATTAFMSYHSDKDVSASLTLQAMWFKTANILKPFMELMDVEKSRDGKQSTWVTDAQKVLSTLSDFNLNKVEINNQIYEPDIDFPLSKPELSVNEGKLTINTTANVRYGLLINPLNPRTADEIEGKMKRMEAIKREAERAGLGLTFKKAVTCKEANMAAWERALATASPIVRQRYEAKEITVQFENDEIVFTGPGWLLGDLTFKLENGVLRIKSVALVTDLDVILGVEGMHYCKLLSPARALEFMAIDALKRQQEN